MNKNKYFIIASLIVTAVLYTNCGQFQSSQLTSSSELDIDGSNDGTDATNPHEDVPGAPAVTPNPTRPRVAAKAGGNFSSAYRVLTGSEIQKSLELILSTSFSEITDNNFFPELSNDLFESNQFNSGFSQAHFIGLEKLGELIEAKLTADNHKLLKQVLPCIGQNNDQVCRKNAVDYFAPLFLRRPVSAEQYTVYERFVGNMDGLMDNRLINRVPMFVSALAQSTSFIIRKEVGLEGNTSYALTPYEIASRMSFFLTGSGPDTALLDAAAGNKLNTAVQRHAHAVRLLNTQRGQDHIVDINKELFRIDNIKAPNAIKDSLAKESELLLKDVIFTKQLAWKEIFSSDGTFINRTLASHYKMTAPNDSSYKYTKYTNGDKAGILSHGSFLSKGYAGEPENTSPIRRGLQIVEDLLCRHLPPPSDVDIDNDPAGALGDECNIDARKMTTLRPGGSCTGCHNFMEPLGLAFERFNLLGQYRTSEKDRPECTTIEPGLLTNVPFSTIPELGKLIKKEADLDDCLASRMAEYAFAAPLEAGHVTSIIGDLPNYQKDKKLTSLVIDLVSSAQFIRRDK